MATKIDLDPVSFAYDYMRRTDQVSHDDLKARDPHFTQAYEALKGAPDRSLRENELATLQYSNGGSECPR